MLKLLPASDLERWPVHVRGSRQAQIEASLMRCRR